MPLYILGTSKIFSEMDIHIPDDWCGKYLETLSHSALQAYGILDYVIQEIALKNVSTLIEQVRLSAHQCTAYQ